MLMYAAKSESEVLPRTITLALTFECERYGFMKRAGNTVFESRFVVTETCQTYQMSNPCAEGLETDIRRIGDIP